MKTSLITVLLLLFMITSSIAQTTNNQSDNSALIDNTISGENTQVSEEYIVALEAFFTSMNSDDIFKKTISQMMALQKSYYPNADDELWDLLEKKLLETSINDLIVDLAPVYQKHLTIDDLNKLTAFFNTSVGKKYAEATPDIVTESMKVGAQWGQKLGLEFLKLIEEYEESNNLSLGS